MARADSCEPSKLEATGTEIPEVVVVLAVDDGCACATEVDWVKRGVGRLNEDTVVVVEVVEFSAGECVGGGRGGTEDRVVCEGSGGSEVGVVMASPSPPRVSSEIGKTSEAGSRLTQEDGGMFWSGSGGGGGSWGTLTLGGGKGLCSESSDSCISLSRSPSSFPPSWDTDLVSSSPERGF